jgi:hypothetical protein
MSFKRTKVVMLSTNEKASLRLLPNGLLFSNPLVNEPHLKNQELYFLSDEEIKEGDWCINLNSFLEHKELCRIDSKIELERYVQKIENDCKKIIATTNKDLGITLPQPSESFIKKFIEAYNSGKAITEVMVEYNHLQSTTGLNEEWLKINIDNTITIRKMKDSWSREEVISLCTEAINYGKDYNGNLSEKWIEENFYKTNSMQEHSDFSNLNEHDFDLQFTPTQELIEFADELSKKFMMLDPANYFSDNKKYQIDIVMKAPMDAHERPTYNIARIGHISGIIELEKHHFLTAKGYQYSPDYLFYIILFLACEKGVRNQVISERMTLEYYKTTGRPLLEILQGYTWMSSFTSNAVFIQRFRIVLEFIEKHKQEVKETK